MSVKSLRRSADSGRAAKAAGHKSRSVSSAKPAGKHKAPGLSRAALDFLAANSPTPEIFNEVPDHPPFDLLDK